MHEIKAPEWSYTSDNPAIFLGGSIEMGTAEDWQARLKAELCDYNVTLYNPRRNDWDASWEQSIHNKQFKEQVVWELKHLEDADTIIFYFAPGTKSPITLLELGLFAKNHHVIVCCPEGFWRKGNVDIVCECYNVQLVETFDDLVIRVKSIYKNYCANISPSSD